MRIEGCLRIEVIVAAGVVTDAFSAGTQIRGLDKLLKGRDPREAWSFTERIGGVCTTVHALASCRAVEDALGLEVPANAELVRNLMFCAQFLQDHVVRFYHLHAQDWVDLAAMAAADPAATAKLARTLSPWPKAEPDHFASVQQRLKPYVEGGPAGIFAHGFRAHPAYRLPPELNLLVVSHYLDALAWNQDIVKIHTLFGGRQHHPEYRVGGLPHALDAGLLEQAAGIIRDALVFVEQVYVPDLLTVAGFYKDWATLGGGLENYLAYGDLPTRGYRDPASFRLPRGAILGRDLGTVHPVDARDLDLDARLGTPRWQEHPMEVGPLARMLVAHAQGGAEVRALVGEALGKLDLPFPALFSTLGRTVARGVEAQVLAHWMKGFLEELGAHLRHADPDPRCDPGAWPAEAAGVGMTEAPRGALAHQVRIKDRVIDAYRMVIPSTWNASPRDASGRRSSYEAALIGTPVADAERPVELLRTLHAFDPCVPCRLLLRDGDGRPLNEVQFN